MTGSECLCKARDSGRAGTVTPQHLQGCQVPRGAGISSFPPQPLICPPEAAEPVPKKAEQILELLPQMSPKCPNKEDKLIYKKHWE